MSVVVVVEIEGDGSHGLCRIDDDGNPTVGKKEQFQDFAAAAGRAPPPVRGLLVRASSHGGSANIIEKPEDCEPKKTVFHYTNCDILPIPVLQNTVIAD